MSCSKKDNEIVELDANTLDMVRVFRSKGFLPEEITLMTLVADPEVICSSRKEYQRRLLEFHGINMSYKRVCELLSSETFQDCVTKLYSVEETHSMRAVWKNMYRKGRDPRDPQAVAAANLIFKAKGVLQPQAETNPTGGPSNYEAFLDEFWKAQREGKNPKMVVRERSISVEAGSEEVLQPEGDRSLPTVEGKFHSGDSEEDPPSSEGT